VIGGSCLQTFLLLADEVGDPIDQVAVVHVLTSLRAYAGFRPAVRRKDSSYPGACARLRPVLRFGDSPPPRWVISRGDPCLGSPVSPPRPGPWSTSPSPPSERRPPHRRPRTPSGRSTRYLVTLHPRSWPLRRTRLGDRLGRKAGCSIGWSGRVHRPRSVGCAGGAGRTPSCAVGSRTALRCRGAGRGVPSSREASRSFAATFADPIGARRAIGGLVGARRDLGRCARDRSRRVVGRRGPSWRWVSLVNRAHHPLVTIAITIRHCPPRRAPDEHAPPLTYSGAGLASHPSGPRRGVLRVIPRGRKGSRRQGRRSAGRGRSASGPR